MVFNIRQTIGRLQQENEKGYYLAILRILVTVWFIKELFFRWPAFDWLYAPNSFLHLPPSLSLVAFGINVDFLHQHYMALVWCCLVLLILNLFGIGRNLVSLLLYLSINLLYHLNNKFANSGDEMSVLLLLYLSFANTFSHFVLFKRTPFSPEKEKVYNLISNLAAYSIIINLCLAYFMAGAFKVMDPYWRQGWGIYYFINDDRYSIFAAGGRHVPLPWLASAIVGYGTILTELLFPFLVFEKRTRNIILIICLLMHIGIYSFLMIYGMSVIFVIQYGLFYSNIEVMTAVEKVKTFTRKRFRFVVKR